MTPFPDLAQDQDRLSWERGGDKEGEAAAGQGTEAAVLGPCSGLGSLAGSDREHWYSQGKKDGEESSIWHEHPKPASPVTSLRSASLWNEESLTFPFTLTQSVTPLPKSPAGSTRAWGLNSSTTARK